ncbi:MAG TPA: hypothetical protein VIB38_08120, partial [Aestuariivirgaceae bacterium]
MTVSSDVPTLASFVEQNAAYYSRTFQQLVQHRRFFSLNLAALLAGPLWAAARRLWGLFWFGLFGELLAIILAGRALLSREAESASAGVDWSALLTALCLFAAVRLIVSLLANAAYLRRYERWRVDNSIGGGFGGRPLLAGVSLLLAIYPLTLYRFWSVQIPAELAAFPAAKGFAKGTANGISALFDWMTIEFEAFFDAVTAFIRVVLNHIDLIFVTTPWPVT